MTPELKSDPAFEPFDLTELQDEGVLMAANERFFWPLGLALTWTHNEDGTAEALHVRQWVWADGHRETISIAEGDRVAPERRRRFGLWLASRIEKLPSDERDRADALAIIEGDKLEGLRR